MIKVKKQVKIGNAKLDIVCDARVMPSSHRDENYIIIIENNDPAFVEQDEDGDDVEYYPYYCMRIQLKNRTNSLKRHRDIFPDSKIIHEIKGVPNAVQLWNTVKKKLIKKNKIILNGCYFELDYTLTKRQFLRKLEAIYDKRMDI